MTEILFGLTVLFVGYVIYEVFKTVSRPAPVSQTHLVTEPSSATAETAAQTVVAEEAEEAVVEQAAPAAEEAEKEEGGEEKASLLRNPATGETSAVPTNYRFAKKWIKEAMVAEGLLDRVYRNSELSDEIAHKVKEALERFKELPKYQA
ncbi:MAG TPA: hypothetical protein VNL74_08210 [Methylococcus sp.]|nr:hypothetical protein [Methylococcus sp.]